MFSAENISATY